MHRHGTGRWQCGGLTEGWGRVNSVSIIHESNLLIFIRGYQQKLPSYVGIFFSGSQVSGSQVFSLVFCFYKLRYHGIHHRIIWNSTFWNFFPPHLKQLGPWWSLSSPFRIGLDWTPKWPNSMTYNMCINAGGPNHFLQVTGMILQVPKPGWVCPLSLSPMEER